MLEINRTPSRRDLNWFGVLFALAFGILGFVLFQFGGARTAAAVIWSLAALVAIVYYAVPPIRRTVYVGWMYITFPIGWTVSHLMMAAIYYLVVTPIGLCMRLLGRDPLHRRFDAGAATYWIEHDPESDPARYFKQF